MTAHTATDVSATDWTTAPASAAAATSPIDWDTLLATHAVVVMIRDDGHHSVLVDAFLLSSPAAAAAFVLGVHTAWNMSTPRQVQFQALDLSTSHDRQQWENLASLGSVRVLEALLASAPVPRRPAG